MKNQKRNKHFVIYVKKNGLNKSKKQQTKIVILSTYKQGTLMKITMPFTMLGTNFGNYFNDKDIKRMSYFFGCLIVYVQT